MDSLSLEQAETSSPKVVTVERKQIKAENITERYIRFQTSFHLSRIIHFKTFEITYFLNRIVFK